MRWTAVFAAAVLAASVDAQCPFASAQITGYGQGCPLSSSPLLIVQFAPGPCTLTTTFSAPPQSLIGSWIGFSYSPSQSVQPGLGSCPLLDQPFAIVAVGAAGTLQVSIPPGLLPMIIYIDAVALGNPPPFMTLRVYQAVAPWRVALQ